MKTFVITIKNNCDTALCNNLLVVSFTLRLRERRSVILSKICLSSTIVATNSSNGIGGGVPFFIIYLQVSNDLK